MSRFLRWIMCLLSTVWVSDGSERIISKRSSLYGSIVLFFLVILTDVNLGNVPFLWLTYSLLGMLVGCVSVVIWVLYNIALGD